MASETTNGKADVSGAGASAPRGRDRVGDPVTVGGERGAGAAPDGRLGELAATIAHEVRNPLAGMRGALEVLRKELDANPSNVEVVEELLAQMARLEQLVRDLLSFSRPTAVRIETLDLHELLDGLLRRYNQTADGAGITVQRIYEPDTARLEADGRQMEQAFTHLLLNAVQAMEPGGTLTVSTHRTDAALEITFRDTGCGIPAADLHRVLLPFYTTKHRGSGLGLPIARRITEAHGGKLSLESRPGRGTSVTVALPVR